MEKDLEEFIKKVKSEETISIPGEFPLNLFIWKVDKRIDKYVKGLKDKKIFGIACPICGTVYVPPKEVCRCFNKTRDWVEVSDEGVVTSFAIGYGTASGGTITEFVEPKVTILAKLDGSDTAFMANLIGAKVEDVRVGMRIRAVWVDEPTGALLDIDHFEPIE